MRAEVAALGPKRRGSGFCRCGDFRRVVPKQDGREYARNDEPGSHLQTVGLNEGHDQWRCERPPQVTGGDKECLEETLSLPAHRGNHRRSLGVKGGRSKARQGCGKDLKGIVFEHAHEPKQNGHP